MITSAEVASGKGATDENFPVASHLIARKHRPAVMAFYDFVRAADDVADHATLSQADKLAILDEMEASLLGRADSEPVARPLRAVLAERRLSPRHALDLLAAFKLDCTKNRTADWDDLIHYCSLSAMPVGRYVLDVHGESEATWAASDAVCAALQIVNHLQDCGKDYRNLDRVYIPDDALARAGVQVEALGADTASAGLRAVLRDLADRTMGLLDDGRVLAEAGARLPPEPRDGRHHHPGAPAHRHAAGPRPAEPEGPSQQGSLPRGRRAGRIRGCCRPPASPVPARDAAREHVVTITPGDGEPRFATAARQASGSSFYAGMRVLPKPQREAMYEIYAFCRAVDDVADEGGTRPERLAGLARWRDAIEAVYAGRTTAATAGLLEPIRRFKLARVDFLAIIDGMEMDGREDIRAPSEETLDLYCDRVASAVGRLSVKIFGIGPEIGEDLAHHLGRALQLTNILRDLDEDADMGRLYLPKELLVGAGISSSDPKTVLASTRLGEACGAILARARQHFSAAEALMAKAPRRTTRAPRLMAAVYRTMLDGLEARGFAPPREKIRMSKPKLILTALRHWLF